MTILEFLKLLYRNIFVILITILICLGAGLAASNALSSKGFENTLFLSIGVQDKYQSSDAYENLQAADQITESIQGWFKDPSFQKEINEYSGLGYALKAKKQEKNNIVVGYSSGDANKSLLYKESILEILGERISSYNQLSDLQINLASAKLNVSQKPDSLPLYLILSSLIGLILGMLIAWIYEITFNRLTSLNEFSQISGVEAPFCYESVKKLKSRHQFLIKYLSGKYHDNKIQLLDLTRGNKTGLEFLSKHGQFSDIKSFKIPQEIEQVNISHPSVIICELGYTDKTLLKNITLLGFTHIEAIILDRI